MFDPWMCAAHRWQSSSRHARLRDVMADRPDLIQSELAGLSFDSTQELFRATHLDHMFSMVGPTPPINTEICVFVDPAAGGPSSDYAILSVNRHQGVIMVRCSTHTGKKLTHCPTEPPQTRQDLRPTGPPPTAEPGKIPGTGRGWVAQYRVHANDVNWATFIGSDSLSPRPSSRVGKVVLSRLAPAPGRARLFSLALPQLSARQPGPTLN